MIRFLAIPLSVAAVLSVGPPVPGEDEPPVPKACGGHEHRHLNYQHKAFVKRLYRNPWLPKKAKVKHRHMLACAATPTDSRLMRKRWKVVKSPRRGVAVPNWPVWVRVGRCEMPGPGRWGINWHFSGPVYSGGLGFANSSWLAYRLKGFPSNAGDATWRQQMLTANNLWQSVGWGWGCPG